MTDDMSQFEPPHPSRIGILISSSALVVVMVVIGIGLYLAQRPAPFLVQGIVQTDEVRVSLKTTGRVTKLYVREGDRVAKGEVVATITSPEIDGALAQLKRAEAADDLAQSTWRRVASLYKSGVVPAQKRDEAEAGARASTEAVSMARSTPAILMDGAKISADGGALDVLAPISGEVSTREVNEGELAPAGYPMFTLISPGNVWLTLNLREDQFHGLKMGQVVEGEVPALGIVAQFRVNYIGAEGDFATWRATRASTGYDVRSFEIRAVPVTPVAGLRPGMSVLVRHL
jgi:HlyD family secretion protein